MVRYAKPTIIRVNSGGGRKVRRYRRRSGGRLGGMKADLKSLGFDFAYSAGYGYLREGGTDNFNELMDKVPGANSIGKDLRNALVFYAVDRYLVRSSVLRGLSRAAVSRAGYKFGQNKFTSLQGDDGNY
jgi:hypothetical protein